MTDNRPDNESTEGSNDPVELHPEVQRAPQAAPGSDLAEQQEQVDPAQQADSGNE